MRVTRAHIISGLKYVLIFVLAVTVATVYFILFFPSGWAGLGPAHEVCGEQDSDGDGLTDIREIFHDRRPGYNPYDPVLNPRGTDTDIHRSDTDGDGFNDCVESESGSDPLVRGSTPALIWVNFQSDKCRAPRGYVADSGKNDGAWTGFGWRKQRVVQH